MKHWILCPVCGNKTRLRIRSDTKSKNFPLYCPKCKQKSLINTKALRIYAIALQTCLRLEGFFLRHG